MGIYSAQVTVGQIRGPGFNPSVVHVRSVVNKVPVGKEFLSKDCVFFLPNANITVLLHINLPSGARIAHNIKGLCLTSLLVQPFIQLFETFLESIILNILKFSL